MKVRVTRYSEETRTVKGRGGRVAIHTFPTYNGSFISEVYAIEDDRFLVWDCGDYGAIAGFCWVDFTETMQSPTQGEEWREPVVELWEEEE